ncbi:helix-turn-helix transcriptional regulator [Streptomyces sp. NPDC048737]|uniref:helix-turn-helix domain-containing protein n=1 Tax=unclassified Streptomyces TaxID=2593676 RepID=UPI003440F9D4
MPRPETPIDPSAGPVERFAYDLRQLRKAAGNPSYREMSAAVHFSGTTLSEAARGKRHPSLAVTLAYVQACGGDPEEWRERWLAVEQTHAAATRQETLRDAEAPTASSVSPVAHQRTRIPPRAIAMAASAGAIGGILTVACATVALSSWRASLRSHLEGPVRVLEAAHRR